MQETLRSNSFLITTREFFDLRLEYNDQFSLVHLPRIEKVTKGVLLDILFNLQDISKMVKVMGKQQGLYAAIGANDRKMKKLVTMLNFEMLGHDDNLDLDVYIFKGDEE